MDVIGEVQTVVGNIFEDHRNIGASQYPADRAEKCRCRIEIAAEGVGIVVGCGHGVLTRIEGVVHGEGLNTRCEAAVFEISDEDVLHVLQTACVGPFEAGVR